MQYTVASNINHKLSPESGYAYAASAVLYKSQQTFVTSEKVNPNQRASAPHFHRDIDEVAIITQGNLIAVEGDEEIELTVGDSIFFTAGSKKKHFLENRSDQSAEFILVKAGNFHPDDVVY